MESIGSKHRPQSNRGISSSKHKDNKPQKRTVPDPELPRGLAMPTSFLFIVNEFDIDFEVDPVTDQWFNYMPPLNPNAYRSEYTGLVFRYRSGTVSLAAQHTWFRPSMSQPGRIVRTNPYGQVVASPPVYKTHSVFSCSPHLPLIVLQSDAALGSAMRTPCSCSSKSATEETEAWSLLHFSHSQGVSRATANCQGQTWVAGRKPSWMPALVPLSFENTRPDSDVPRSAGLAGELPLVIGLMAFHGGIGRSSDVFVEGMWERRRWRGSREAPKGYPIPDACPRGFVVQVCLDLAGDEEDPEAEEAALAELYNLEWNNVLVEG